MSLPGYLMPDTFPTETACMKVFYPQDSIFQAALIGSIAYLGTWVAWERTPDKRGTVAAQLWKSCLDMTIDALSDGCDNENTCELCDMTKEELQNYILEALEAMTINNNINIGCGCGCGCGGTVGASADSSIKDEPTDDYNDSLLPPGERQNQAQKCSFCSYLVYTLRLMLMKGATHDGDVNTFNDYWDSLFSDLSLDNLSSIAYESYVWILAQINGEPTAAGLIAGLFDEHYNYLVCLLMGSTDERNAYERLVSGINSTIKDIPIQSAARQIAKVLPYHLLFSDLGEYPIPAGWESRTCCGEDYSVPVLPEFPPMDESCLPAGVVVSLVEPTSVTQDESFTSLAFDYDNSTGIGHVIQTATSSSSFSTPGVVFNYALPAIGTRLGFVVEFIENASTATSVKLFGKTLDGLPLPYIDGSLSLSSYRACLESILVDVFPGHGRDTVADATDLLKIEADRARPSSGTNVLDLTFRVWEIVDTGEA